MTDAFVVAGTAVYVEGGGSLKLRRSKLLSNDTGLMFRFSGMNELDLGGALDLGGNTFGTKMVTNKRMGICLPAAPAAVVQARGNNFNLCPPSAMAFATAANACDLVPVGAYKDVYFVGDAASTAPPLDTMVCGSP